MDVLFLQTAEATYAPLLELSAQTVKEYCTRQGFTYQAFFGILRGYHAWHATYNRITLLKQLLDLGRSGWVCYLDADAYVCDLTFDLKTYLRNKEDVALIIAPASDTSLWWQVNAGILLLNLSHPIAQAIVREWSRGFDQITDDKLRAAVAWSEVTDDQQLLHRALRAVPGAEAHTLIEKNQPRLLNYLNGTFIRQILRAQAGLEGRVNFLRSEVLRILGTASQDSTLEAPKSITGQRPEDFVRALYRILLLREPDAAGLEKGVRLVGGGVSFEDLMRSCLHSEEFAAKYPRFIEARVHRAASADVSTVVNLSTLADKYRSDKGLKWGSPPHKYTYLYDLIFESYKEKEIDFLEIGLAAGGPEVGGPIDRKLDSPSIQMWLEYFPRARIYGFDISDFSHMRRPRFTFIRGDSGSAKDLERLANASAGFDVVIDDGSHASYHQQLAFRHLFPKLRRGGTYIIEDLQWQSPAFEGKPFPLPKTADFMISFFERNVYLRNDVLSEEFMRSSKAMLSSWAWFPAFDGNASAPKLFIFRKRPI